MANVRRKKKKGVPYKMMVAFMAVTLLVGCAIGGTVAWLTATSDPVTNTFTYGNIGIRLYEHYYDADKNELDLEREVTTVENYKIIPGKDLPKDPTVEFTVDSEPCYVFIKKEVTGTFVDDVTYSVDSSVWTPLDGVDNVWYKLLDNGAKNGDKLNILYEQMITVSEDLTKEDVTGENGATIAGPVLEFTAYAIQKESFSTPAAAWTKIPKTTTPAE